MSPARGYGSGRKSVAWTMVKSAVGAAMPSASVPIAARAKERWCNSCRATRMTSRAMSIGPRSASLALVYSPLNLREETGAENRPVARHARFADPQDPDARPESRLGHFEPHPADLARGAERESGVSLPGAASARAWRRHRVRNDDVRKQSPGARVQAHGRRAPAPRRRDRQLGALRAFHQADSPGGVTTW